MRSRIIVFTILLTILYSTTTAQVSHNWTRTNPGGGGAFSTVGASASGIIVAGSDLTGAYISSNGGVSWTAMGVAEGLPDTHVSGVGFHPTDGNTLYIGTDYGLFRSTNGGNSVSNVLLGGYVTDIEISRSNTQIGYASWHPVYDSDSGVVFKTIDGGLTWAAASSNLPISGMRILKLLVNAQNANTVYLLAGYGRFAPCSPAHLYRSTDGGVNWSRITTSLGSILDIDIDQLQSQNVYLTTMNAHCDSAYYHYNLAGAMHQSTDGGTTWTQKGNHTGQLFVSATTPATIRIIDPREPWPWNPEAGTWQTTNSGTSWTHTGLIANWETGHAPNMYWGYGSSFNGICKTIGHDLSDPNKMYWINSQWVYGTSNGGSTFENLNTNEVSPGWWQSTGYDNITLAKIATSEANADRIYLGFFDIGLWRSLDHGVSWQTCNDIRFTREWEGNGGNTLAILADPARQDVVWATMQDNRRSSDTCFLVKSTMAGDRTSWTNVSTGLPVTSYISGLSLAYTSTSNNRTMYVTAEGDVYKSTNDGNSWSKVFDCNGCRFTAVDRFDANLVYAGGENGLWRSTTGGGLGSWTQKGTPEMTGLGFNNDVEGWHWYGVVDMAVDPFHADSLYVAVIGPGRGLYRCTNKGDNCTKIWADDYMRTVALSPTHSDIIYAGASTAFVSGGYSADSDGVLYSSDGGVSFQTANDGMTWPFCNDVAIDNKPIPSVLVASNGTGFQMANVPLATLSIETKQPLTAKGFKDKIELSWQTSWEVNSDYFVIKKSVDAQNWAIASLTKARGTATTGAEYKVYDVDYQDGMNYYSLWELNRNGDTVLAGKASLLWRKTQNKLKLSPNPTENTLHVSWIETRNKKVDLRIWNIYGEIIFQKENINSFDITVSLESYASGLYWVQLIDSEGQTAGDWAMRQ